MRTTQIPPTTTAGEDVARDIYRGDWDADGTTSLYLPTAIAEQLLRARGWQRLYSGHIDPQPAGWRSPTGHRCWETAEALQIAITADVAGPENA